jgi:hypothetical protein
VVISEVVEIESCLSYMEVDEDDGIVESHQCFGKMGQIRGVWEPLSSP